LIERLKLNCPKCCSM